MELAATGLFRAKWTDAIHEEWISNLLANRSDLDRGRLERTRDLMNKAVPDCLVENYQGLIGGLELPDPNDRHVLAAAIMGGCDAIITVNLKHFPVESLRPYNIEPQHPDQFIHHQFDLHKHSVVISAQRCRARLKNPPVSAKDYLDTLEQQGLVLTTSGLSDYAGVI